MTRKIAIASDALTGASHVDPGAAAGRLGAGAAKDT
jgi:hypothetical protein